MGNLSRRHSTPPPPPRLDPRVELYYPGSTMLQYVHHATRLRLLHRYKHVGMETKIICSVVKYLGFL